MPLQFDTLSALLDHGFDTVIDVRSPAEFAEDHLPGALNLPALDNAQRAEVGTMYKQISPFNARKVGAGMVVRNVADHLDGPLREKDGAWRPLVYCWRGGQRSGVFRTLLSEIGWRAETIKGGYQTYRRRFCRKNSGGAGTGCCETQLSSELSKLAETAAPSAKLAFADHVRHFNPGKRCSS